MAILQHFVELVWVGNVLKQARTRSVRPGRKYCQGCNYKKEKKLLKLNGNDIGL